MAKTASQKDVNLSAKENILEQALVLFAAKGFDGASTREIADAAGANHALIKYHFGNKEALWHAAVDRMFARLEEVMTVCRQEMEAQDSPADRFRTLISHYVRYCAEHPEHARITMQESTSENPRLRWAVETHLANSRDQYDAIAEDLFDSGAMPRISKLSLRYIMTTVCQGIFVLAAEAKLMFGVDVTHESQIEAHIDAVTRLFLRD